MSLPFPLPELPTRTALALRCRDEAVLADALAPPP